MSDDAARRPVVLVPYGEDLLARAASQIVSRCADLLPRTENVVVLLPELRQGQSLRRALHRTARDAGYGALLGPRIETIEAFLSRLPLAAPPVIPDDSRDLILLDALRQHADLFGDADLLHLSRSLLALFDELNLQQRELPVDLTQFETLLRRAYGIKGAAPRHMSREAEIVHTLWFAWHKQLAEDGAQDRSSWYVQLLGKSLEHIPEDCRIFVVGHHRLRPAEQMWLKTLVERGQAHLIVQGGIEGSGYHPDTPVRTQLEQLRCLQQINEIPGTAPRSVALNQVFDTESGPLAQRAADTRRACPESPLIDQLRVFTAADSEQEARAVELQVRRWLLAGRRRIGIVSEDRRLARRIRALLERAGVALADGGGWALSTTSSATVIERWLEAIEEDFAHQPLLDVLKSPFLLPEPAQDADRYRHAIHRLEQDIILHENIPRGLDRFRKHLRFRQRRLGWSVQASKPVHELLDRLEHAAEPFRTLRRQSTQPLHDYLAALRESLNRLQVWSALNRDEAGAQLIQLLERMQQAAQYRNTRCEWITFRSWLGASLEAAHFRPASTTSRVQLLSLEQSAVAGFDAVVIAGAERDFLPGQPQTSPYFNDSVRRELGLETWRDRLSLRLYYFRRLLESAPTVLLSHRREQDGEPVLASPWVEAIRTFHEMAYGHDLHDPTLADLLADPRSQVASPDPTPLPTPAPNPRPRLPAARLPQYFSAGAQQHLIDCPYQFFAADCLRLKPMEEVREALEKSDYGERVHRCLEAFHGGIEGLPGPVTAPLQADTRAGAIELLERISLAVFAQDLEDNFLHRGWLKRWLAMIPAYVDWQTEREQQWRTMATERSAAQSLNEHWQIKGRLDRVDRNPSGRHAIIDYKTGAVPSASEVQSGEAVQLVSYAMLLEDVEQVEYLQLDQQIRSVSTLAGAELAQLQAAVRARLLEVLGEISAGAALPAWGDPDTCAYCAMAGVCRRQTWDGPVR